MEATLKNKLKTNLNILLAISLLEYEDSNYLSGNNETRAEQKIKLIQDALNGLYEYEVFSIKGVQNEI